MPWKDTLLWQFRLSWLRHTMVLIAVCLALGIALIGIIYVFIAFFHGHILGVLLILIIISIIFILIDEIRKKKPIEHSSFPKSLVPVQTRKSYENL
jgi:c-di-AMP phosphodiesterase-like protein